MVFGQLTSRERIRYLTFSLESLRPEFYLLGFGNITFRRNLGNANDYRDYRILEEFVYILIEKAVFFLFVTIGSGKNVEKH